MPGAVQLPPAAPLSAGSHVIQVRSEGESGVASGITQPAAFSVDPALLVDAAGLELRYELEGTRYVQPYQDESGCLALRGDGEWTLRVHPPAPSKTQMVTLHVPLRCPAGRRHLPGNCATDKAYPLGAVDGASRPASPWMSRPPVPPSPCRPAAAAASHATCSWEP